MKAIKILCITSSILVSSSLFAETPQPQQVNEATSKTMPYGDNPSLYAYCYTKQEKAFKI